MEINSKDILNGNVVLSSSMYSHGALVSDGKKISDFVSSYFKGDDLAKTDYYMNTKFMIIKTGSVQNFSSIPIYGSENFECINPHKMKNQNIKRGDIILSKDSNVGQSAILDDDYDNCMLSGAFYDLKFEDEDTKWFVFSYLISDMYKQQLDLVVPKGATIRHGGKNVLELKIPKSINKYKEKLGEISKSIFYDDLKIRDNFNDAMNIINEKLHLDNTVNSFTEINVKDLSNINRIDSEFYTGSMEKYHKIENELVNINQLGYELSRGQNLQKSTVGLSKKSSESFLNSFRVIYPKYFSDEGFLIKDDFFGSKIKLKKNVPGDIVFAAEGAKNGKSYIVPDGEVGITNIHGLIIRKKDGHRDLKTSVSIKYCLDYYRKYGIIDGISAGGHGGSLGIEYWKYLKFPVFDNDTKNKLYCLYLSSKNSDDDKKKKFNIINRIIK